MSQRAVRQLVNRGGEDGAVTSLARTLLAVGATVPTVLRVGWHSPPLGLANELMVLHVAQIVLVAAYGILLGMACFGWGSGKTGSGRRGKRVVRRRAEVARITRPEQATTLMALALAWWPVGMELAAAGLLVIHAVRSYLRLVQTSRVPPGWVFLGSFLALIVVGTAALKLPAATPVGMPISWEDSAFTITSAISQTGLVVRSTGEGFTRFGQIIILIWIQVGALGVIVFGALLAMMLGSGFGLRATQTIAEGTEQGWTGQLSAQKLVTFIIVFTHAVEAVGAAVFYFGWPDTWAGMPGDMVTGMDRLYHSVFFSISSFCGAGFVTTGDSVESLRMHWVPHVVIAPLIVLGAIGFPVLDNLRRVAWARVRGRRTEHGSLIRLSLNTRIVLVTTCVLYVVGFVLIFVSEVTQVHVDWRMALYDAHFMTVNRTAGFNTVDPAEMGMLSRLSLVALMFVGGSPGSVAGGIKVMVLAVMALTVWATIRGRRETTVFGRTLPDHLVRKSATLIVLSLGLVMVVTGVLAATEEVAGRVGLGPLLFETVSAFGTTGLSMGVTAELTTPGKLAIMVAMFAGRVGTFAVMAALVNAAKTRRSRVEFPVEDVVVY